MSGALTSPQEWMTIGAMALFAGFIPILCGISVYWHHDQSNRRLNAAVTFYGLGEDRYYKCYLKKQPVALWKQAFFPVSVIFFIALYFSFLMVDTDQAIGGYRGLSNLLVVGPEWQQYVLKDGSYRVGTFTTESFAFLGWYVWSIATIFSRLTTLELVAATYTNVLMRLVMAVLIAIVFRHLTPSLGGNLSSVAIGFGVGIFPDAALMWISRELRSRLLGQTAVDNEMPLDLIQGISPYRKLRLYEMGMDNCQNLAASNPIQLFVTSNLSLPEVLDWISQAQLAVLVGAENFTKLQSNGWRRALDFERACGGAARPVVSKLIGYDECQLDDVRKGLLEDPNFGRVEALQHRIRKADGDAAARQPGKSGDKISLASNRG
jgi:hypothetical protein